MKAWGEEKVWHKQIMNRWCDMWKCETWQREESKKKKGNSQVPTLPGC